MGSSHLSKQEQLILAQGEDSKKGQLIYLMRKGSFQVILYKMIRFLSGKLKKHTKLAKIVKISEIFNRLVFPLNFNRFCHPMTKTMRNTFSSKQCQCPMILCFLCQKNFKTKFYVRAISIHHDHFPSIMINCEFDPKQICSKICS